MRNCALYLGVKSFIGLAYSEVTPLAELCLSRVGRYSPEQSMADGKRVTPMRRFYIDCTAAYVWSLCRCGSMVEQLICNQLVVGSNPIIGSMKNNVPWNASV